MYVKDHMTKNPICISPDTSISKSLDLMAKNHFHRLPVVDENGKLTGLITEGLVSESSGKNQTSLDIFQLNYLLSRTKAKDIMIKDVTTISPDVFLEEAAGAMLKAGSNAVDLKKAVFSVTGCRYKIGVERPSEPPAPPAPEDDPLASFLKEGKKMGVDIQTT